MTEPIWYIKVHSTTHGPAGHRRSFSKILYPPYPQGFHIEGWLSTNLPALFHGCDVTVKTPLNTFHGTVDPDHPHEFRYDRRSTIDNERPLK